MNVTRVHTEHGSHIEPPLDPNWDDFKKLVWHAAVISHDTGLQIAVHAGGCSVNRFGEWRPADDTYNLVIESSSSAPHTFHGAWKYLNGVDCGAAATRRLMEVQR